MGNRKLLILVMLLLSVFLVRSQVWGEFLSPKNLSFEATAGWDFDSNASQQPHSPAAAALVPGRGSAVYTQNAKLGYSFNPAGPFDLETKYDYYQNFHTRRPLTQFDVLMHTATVRPSYLFGSTKLFLPFIYNFTDVQSDKYATSYLLQPTVFHRFTQDWGLEVGMNLAREYAWAPITVPEYDRSGRKIGSLLGLYYFINQKGFLQARFGYDFFDAVGQNNVGSRFHILFNALYQPHERVKLNAFLDLGLEPYDHRYFDGTATAYPRRNDTILNLGGIVTFNIYKGFDFNVHYYFTRDYSNVTWYDYSRHMVGGLLSYTYGR